MFSSFPAQMVVVFGTALVAAALFGRLRAPSVIGFLISGMLIGPSGLGIIEQSAVAHFAEFGLVLLLFTVGLELSPEPLMRMGWRILAASSMQILATTAAAFFVVRAFAPLPNGSAAIIGLVVALSSTAIVLKQLSERRETATIAGGLITGVLLVQDILVILVMMFMPLMAGRAGAHWSGALGHAVLALGGLAVVTLAARRVLPSVLNQLLSRGGPEMTTLFSVVMACSGAWLAGLAGWSWALGACIAGLLLSQTDMHHQLFADIMPFRDVFNALFFISMGMLVDLPRVWTHAPMLAAAVVLTLLGKALLAGAAVAVSGWPLRLATQVGLGLSTVSEFGYLLLLEAGQLGLIEEGVTSIVIAYVVGTMLCGGLLVPLSSRVAALLFKRDRRVAHHERPGEALSGHVIIIGYGLNGKNLSHVLRATHITPCVVELNRTRARAARRDGNRVVVGDATRGPILGYAAVATARALVVAINDTYATRRIVAQVHALRPDLYILARTRSLRELDVLSSLGARQVIPEEFETSIEIFAHVLNEFAIPDNIIEAQVHSIRAGRYGMLRGRALAASDQAVEIMHLLEATATQTFLVQPSSPACGRTIRQLDLRAKTGVTIIAVVRAGRPSTNPPPNLQFRAGDVLVIVGAHKELDAAKQLLLPPSREEAAALPED